MQELLLHASKHAAEDSVRMLPFLFAAYWFIEYIEHRHSAGLERVLAGGGRFGFVPAAALGLVPQCGFSAMAANLYGSKVITLGTLLAVFIATSDEAIPILIAMPDKWDSMFLLIGWKLIVALAAGVCIDVLFKRFIPASVRGGYAGSMNEVDCHDHEEQDSILVAAVKHTLHIFLYILIFNFVMGLAVEWIGEDAISALLAQAGMFQPVAAGLLGLVPNCAASVLITQLYAAGSLSLGGAVAGLSTSAGVGLAVLFRTNRSAKQNVFITALLYMIGTVAGLFIQMLGF